MSEPTPTPQVASLQAAVTALEAQEFTRGVSLLVALLDDIDGRGSHAVEATSRALLAQALHQMGQPDAGLTQARAALDAAGHTNDRALIHRCMALVETFRILGQDGL